MRIVLSRGSDGDRVSMSTMDPALSLGRPTGAGGRHLEDIASIDSHTCPLPTTGSWGQNTSLPAYQQSISSRSSFGVIDWKRRTSGTARWERTLWKKLEVGYIVLLKENEQVPADVIVLSTLDPDGICYLETKNLDGETNLKPRKALLRKKTSRNRRSSSDPSHLTRICASTVGFCAIQTLPMGTLKRRVSRSTNSSFVVAPCATRHGLSVWLPSQARTPRST